MDDTAEQGYVGRISGVFGIKGWVKVTSYTEPEENLFAYSPWMVRHRSEWVELEVDQYQRHSNGWIAHLKGIDDRNVAESFKLKPIQVDQNQFAALQEGDFYWYQLVGLRVYCRHTNEDESAIHDVGVVHSLMETGANDVLVVKPDEESIDDRERLIPYVPDMYVVSVDLRAKKMIVDWHVGD